MVFFNCNACGEAMKKNQVEKHTFRCRQCQVVSCVDCGKDFWGNDYQSHTKCMTEDEKYCGKGYVAKVNKGEVKQEKWIEKVQAAIEQSTRDPKLKGLLMRMQDYPNIPRKKAKFENFLKNSMRVLSPFLITQVWDLLMEQTATKETPEIKPTEAKTVSTETTNCAKPEEPSECNGVENNENEQTVKLSKREKKEKRKEKNKREKKDQAILEEGCNGNIKKSKKRKRNDSEEEEVEEKESVKKIKKKRKADDSEEEQVEEKESIKKKKKKRKTDDSDKKDEVDISKENGRLNDTLVSESPVKGDKFKWGATILALIEKKGEISYKKLRRKILQEFSAQEDSNFKEESLQIRFDKKLRKLSNIVISDGRVSLS